MINIKVKHIILVTFVLLISFCFILPMSFLTYGKKVQEKNIDKARSAFSSALAFNPFNVGRDEALYRLASIVLPDEIQRNKYIIYNSGMMLNGQYINYEMVENAEKYLKTIMNEGENSRYYLESYKKLFHLNIMCGKLDKAKILVEEGLKSKSPKLYDMAQKFSMLLCFSERDYDKVLNIGNELIQKNKADHDTYLLMGEAYYIENRFAEASELFGKAKALSQNGLIKNEDRWTFEPDRDAFSNLMLINKAKNLFKGTSKIKGKVEVNGKVVPFAYIYLKNSIDDEFNMTGNERETIFTITDSKGYYEFNNLPERTYSLGIGIYSIYLADSVYQKPKESYLFLKDGETINYDFTFVPPLKVIEPTGLYETTESKVNLSWNNVKNADYYNISAVVFEKPDKLEGSNVTFVIAEDIKDTKHTLDIEKINSNLHGFIIDQEGRVNPQTYIGSFYPGATVPVIIEAYDKNKNKLTSSVPLNVKYESLSLIKISDKNIRNSDKLLLKGDIDNAVIEYEKDLKNDPNDTHSLLVLSKIYSIGTKIKHDKNGKEINEGKNPQRAFELATRLYNITREADYQRNILRSLASSSNRNVDWILEKYSLMDAKTLDYSDYGLMGNLNLIKENFIVAEECYDKAFSMLKDKKFYDLRPVLLNLYNKDYDNAIRYLNKTDLSYYQFDVKAFEDHIKEIKNSSKNTTEYMKFEETLRTVLRMESRQDIIDKFKSEYEEVRNPAYWSILRQIGEYYYLFQQ